MLKNGYDYNLEEYLFVYCFLTALGIKRLASDDFANGWESKRLNAGQVFRSPSIWCVEEIF
jgi:hypothetical protein